MQPNRMQPYIWVRTFDCYLNVAIGEGGTNQIYFQCCLHQMRLVYVDKHSSTGTGKTERMMRVRDTEKKMAKQKSRK